MNHKFKEIEYINSVQSSVKSVGVSITQYNCKYAHGSIQNGFWRTLHCNL